MDSIIRRFSFKYDNRTSISQKIFEILRKVLNNRQPEKNESLGIVAAQEILHKLQEELKLKTQGQLSLKHKKEILKALRLWGFNTSVKTDAGKRTREQLGLGSMKLNPIAFNLRSAHNRNIGTSLAG